MRKSETTMRVPAIAAALALTASLAVAWVAATGARADEIAAAPNDTILSDRGHEFACAGIAESKHDPRWDRFRLKIVAATVEGDYLGDMRVTISDKRGAVVFDAHCEAPWLLVDLPHGEYTARVVARGQFEKTVNTELRTTGQRQIVVRFEGINET